MPGEIELGELSLGQSALFLKAAFELAMEASSILISQLAQGKGRRERGEEGGRLVAVMMGVFHGTIERYACGCANSRMATEHR